MDSTEKIRQMEEQDSNEQPAIKEEPGESGGPSLPVPSISRKQALALGVAAAVVVAVVLYRRESSNDSVEEALKSEREHASSDDQDDQDDQDDEITVPTDHTDPMAADEAVTEEFRKRGRLSSQEDDDGE